MTFLHDSNVKSRTLYDHADIGDSFLWSEWGKGLATLRPVNKQQTTKKNCVFGQNIKFCPKSSKGVLTGLKWFQWSNHFEPSWTTSECWQACYVCPFLFVLLVHFLGVPCIYMCPTTIFAVLPPYPMVFFHLIWPFISDFLSDEQKRFVLFSQESDLTFLVVKYFVNIPATHP